jgi:hypothetical protein
LFVYCSLNNKVDYVASTVYAVTQVNVHVRVLVKVRNEFSVVTNHVIAYKAVELLEYLEFVEYVEL